MTKIIQQIRLFRDESPIEVGNIINSAYDLGIVKSIDFQCDPDYDESYIISFEGGTHTLEVFKPLWVLREDK